MYVSVDLHVYIYIYIHHIYIYIHIHVPHTHACSSCIINSRRAFPEAVLKDVEDVEAFKSALSMQATRDRDSGAGAVEVLRLEAAGTKNSMSAIWRS